MAVYIDDPEDIAAMKRFTDSPENRAWLKKQWDVIHEEARLKELTLTKGIVFLWTGWDQMFLTEQSVPSPISMKWWDAVCEPKKWENWT